jgi:hypothetical protein
MSTAKRGSGAEAAADVCSDPDLVALDVGHLVAHGGFTFRLARVNRAFHAAFSERDELDELSSETPQTILAKLLALKPEEVRRFPHTVKSRNRKVDYMYSKDTVRDIVNAHGGWSAVLARRDKRAARSAAGTNAAATRACVSISSIEHKRAEHERKGAAWAAKADLSLVRREEME